MKFADHVERLDYFDSFTEEDLLDFALDSIASDEPHPIAWKIVDTYVLNGYLAKGKREFEWEEIKQDVELLAVNKLIANLSRKGLLEVGIDENGNQTCDVTEVGKEVLKRERQ